MLSREFRLRRRSDFGRLYRQGQTVHARTFSLRYDTNRLDHPRLAVVVSTKVSKKAVVRNRLRRRFYAQLREVIPEIVPGHDIAVLVRHQAIEQASQDIGSDLRKALTRANLLANP